MSRKLMMTIIVGILLSVGLSSSVLGAEPIRILGTVAFSGDAGNIGPAYDRAMKLAVEEINKAGIKGFSRIEYKVIDTETSLLSWRGRSEEKWVPGNLM